jgi:triosephosphate isomerase
MKFFANWKLNLNIDESLILAGRYLELAIKPEDELIVSPSIFVIDKVRDIFGSKYKVFSQDVSKLNGIGGLTGEVTATILKECRISGSLLGHTERRIKLNEQNEDIRTKLMNCLNEGLDVVLSVGEYGKDIYSYEETIQILSDEFQAILSGLSTEQTSKISVAYEDSEVISSMNVSPVEISYDELHKKIEFIKNTLRDNFNFQNPQVLFGGSVNPQNIQALKALGNIDGFVIGKASLDFQQIQEILNV